MTMRKSSAFLYAAVVGLAVYVNGIVQKADREREARPPTVEACVDGLVYRIAAGYQSAVMSPTGQRTCRE